MCAPYGHTRACMYTQWVCAPPRLQPGYSAGAGFAVGQGVTWPWKGLVLDRPLCFSYPVRRCLWVLHLTHPQPTPLGKQPQDHVPASSLSSITLPSLEGSPCTTATPGFSSSQLPLGDGYRAQSPPLGKGHWGWGPSLGDGYRGQSPPLGKGHQGWGPPLGEGNCAWVPPLGEVDQGRSLPLGKGFGGLQALLPQHDPVRTDDPRAAQHRITNTISSAGTKATFSPWPGTAETLAADIATAKRSGRGAGEQPRRAPGDALPVP